MQKAKTVGRGNERTFMSSTAHDLMTPEPKVVVDTASVGEAIELLEELDVRHLPVVDGEGNLVGILSDRDLRPLSDTNDAESWLRRMRTPVAELMTGGVVYVTPDAELTEIIELMLEHRIGAIPVVDGEGQVAGIVSYVDILRAIMEE